MDFLLKNRFLGLLLLLGMSINSSFSAESLLDIYSLSLESDPKLRQAQIAYAISLEKKRQDVSLLLPSVNISGNTTDNSQKRSYEISLFDGEEDYNSHGYSLSIRQPLFSYENNINLKQSDERINQAGVELVSASQSLIMRVSERYFDVLAAEDNLQFIAAEKQAVERQLKQAESRLNAGLAAITDVYEARARLDATLAQRIEAKNQFSNGLESLREITNSYHERLRPLSESLVLVEPEPSDDEIWVALALQGNLQIVALRHYNRVLRGEISRQRAGHYPTLDLVATYSRSIAGGGNFGRSDSESSAIGLQLNLPVDVGGMTRSRVREAIYQYDKNREEVDATTRAVRSQIRKSYLGVLASIALVQSLKRSVLSSDKALTAIEAGYNVGMRTTSDVLQATRDLYRMQRDYKRARYDYVLNGFRLKQAAGKLSLSDLKQVSLWLE